MKTKLYHLHELFSGKGSTKNGSAYLEGATSITPVHDPFSQGRDAFQISWAQKFVYVFPPFALIGFFRGKGSSESKSESVSNAHNNPSMVRLSMVSRTSKNV